MYKLRYLLKSLTTKTAQRDDFNWNAYSEHYKGELASAKNHSLILKDKDYTFTGHSLLQSTNIPPLHPNHRLIYETILQLDPSSVIEIGCGAGDHLHNLKILGKGIKKIAGIDISAEQLSFLRQRHPSLASSIEQIDITLPLPINHFVYDIAFTHAVIMHMKTGNSRFVALANIFYLARKQVVLMENWTRHKFMEDISFLFKKRMLSWKQIYYYYRESKELGKPHLMIISAVPLKRYPKLSDYSILSKNV